MYTRTDTQQQLKRQPAAVDVSQVQHSNEAAAQLVDSRQKTKREHHLQELIDNSPQTTQFKSYQAIINNSPRIQAAAPVQRITKKASILPSQPIQLATKIEHTSSSISWEGASGEVGKEMIARLDPTDPVRGSATDNSLMTPLDNRVATFNSGMWARGHLLNHDLGGFGVSENLFPISSGANAHHAQAVEYPVKKALAKVNTNRVLNAPADGINILYKVTVKGNPTHAQFHCVWSKADHNFAPIGPVQKTIVDSQLNDSSRSDADDPFFSARGKPQSLPNWHHGLRTGDMDGYIDETGFHESEYSDNLEVEYSSAPIPAIDPVVDIPTDRALTKSQQEEIRKASAEHKLRVRYERDKAKLPAIAKEKAELEIARKRISAKRDRASDRLARRNLKSSKDRAEVSLLKKRYEKQLQLQLDRRLKIDLKRISRKP